MPPLLFASRGKKLDSRNSQDDDTVVSPVPLMQDSTRENHGYPASRSSPAGVLRAPCRNLALMSKVESVLLASQLRSSLGFLGDLPLGALTDRKKKTGQDEEEVASYLMHPVHLGTNLRKTAF